MSNSTVVKNWTIEQEDQNSGLALESCDLMYDGRPMTQGAYRITLNGKPFKKGKGGTVPFKGESAWMDGERAYGDAVLAARMAR
jgi:hypothetical protein